MSWLASSLLRWAAPVVVAGFLFGRLIMVGNERDAAEKRAADAEQQVQTLLAAKAATDAGREEAGAQRSRVQIIYRQARERLSHGSSEACANDPRVNAAYDDMRRMRAAAGAVGDHSPAP